MFDRISPFAAAILVAGLFVTVLPGGDGEGEGEGARKRNPSAIPPITELKDIAPEASAFEKSTATKPLVLRNADDAAKVLSKEQLAKLTRDVDFEQQVVLVFAWRGSGQDKLTFAVAESFPEQVFYSYQRGRTRDLRTHVAVHVLRKNVRWKVM